MKKEFMDKTIYQRFDYIANKFPHHIAYSNEEISITYSELNNKINQLAAAIRQNLSKKNSIALYFEQGVDFIVTFLAIIASGNTAVPLDINSPKNRLSNVLKSSNTKNIIVGNEFDNLSFEDVKTIRFDSLTQDILPKIADTNHIEDEALIIYTSGSTGEPKGVIHTHKSFMHCTYLFTRLMNIKYSDRCTLLYDTAYFGGIRDILNTLLNGASLHHYSIKKRGYKSIPDWLTRNQLTIYTSIVTVFRKLCDEIEGDSDLRNSHLRVVRLGGELSLKSDYDKYVKYFPDNSFFISGLASTECGLIRQNILDKNAGIIDERISNGIPVEDVDVFIKDDEGVVVPDGVTGNVVVCSDFLSPGYKNMPDLTASVYIKNSVTGKQEFMSGDMGLIKDNNLYILGRKDQQIKISGRRIDLTEIESIAMKCYGVTNSAAIFIAEKNLVTLFVEMSKSKNSSIDDIRNFLHANLPFYMQPNRIVLLSSLPLTVNSKVNKKALLEQIDLNAPAYTTVPTDPIEKEVLNVFSSLLKENEIGLHDNFFELGGDSILATSAVIHLEKTFNIKIPFGFIYRAQTASLLAKAIRLNEFEQPFKWLNLLKEGAGTPVFWILDGAFILRKELPANNPLYGINTHYDIDTPVNSLTVENICENFLKEILPLINEKGCIIGGYSMGATFALELAHQLINNGASVHLLILLDPSEPRLNTRHSKSTTHPSGNGLGSLKMMPHNLKKIYWSFSDKSIFMPITLLGERLKSNYYSFWKLMPPENFKTRHVYLFYKRLKEKYTSPKIDRTVLLMQREINVDFEDRVWPKITSKENLIFHTLKVTNHTEVVKNDEIQEQWCKHITTCINTTINLHIAD